MVTFDIQLSDRTNTKAPLPINQKNMATMPIPKYYDTYGKKHCMFSNYFTMIVDYHYITEKELQKRQPRFQQQQHKGSQMEWLLQNTPHLTKTWPIAPTLTSTTKEDIRGTA